MKTILIFSVAMLLNLTAQARFDVGQIAVTSGNARLLTTCSGTAFGGNMILTAAHCFPHGWSKIDFNFPGFVGSVNQGTFKYVNDGYGFDFALIPVEGFQDQLNLGIQMNSHDLENFLKKVQTDGKCISTWGRVSGQQCGKIVAFDMAKNVLVLQLTSRHGDSGGPVWIDNTLLGILHSGYGGLTAASLLHWDVLRRLGAEPESENP